MTRDAIPEDLRRFILTSIISVPYLEAMLLLRSEPDKQWDAKEVAQRLYMSEKAVGELLSELCRAGVLVVGGQNTFFYRYHPRSDELRRMIDRLAEVYTKNLIEITNIIHSKVDRVAQQFADAFKLGKDT
jgi:Mn-dependent DtxR family transcriptional regulator